MRRLGAILLAGLIICATGKAQCAANAVNCGDCGGLVETAGDGFFGSDSSSSLVAHWRLDETGGTIAYDSAGVNHGEVSAGVQAWQPLGGRAGGALELDGVDDYVDCRNNASLNITGEITLSVWVKPNDAGNGEHNPYVTKGDRSYAIKHHSGNKIEFFIYDSYWETVWYPVDGSFNGVWHHLAGTYDGYELRLYVDGKLEATTPHIGSISGSPYDVYIGANAEAAGRFYEGMIDDIRIYNSALTASQVSDLYESASVCYYVDTNAPGPIHDGSSWENAFQHLQDALSKACSGDEIMVAEGIYRPDADRENPGGTDDRTATFSIASGVGLYGGFACGGGDWDTRDATIRETILSGEIGEPGNSADNSYHVVSLDRAGSSTFLDGFTIAGGNASGVSYPDFCGGGLLSLGGGASVSNCRFTDNSAYAQGGAVYCSDSSPSFLGCIISDNQSNTGGGVYNDSSSRPRFSNCSFTANFALSGGALFGGLPALSNCLLFENHAVFGGAIYQGGPTLSNCTLYGNYLTESSEGGGGGINANGALLTNCILWSNRANGQIDQADQVVGSNLTVNYCCIEGWTGALGGTGNFGSSPLLSDPGNRDFRPGPCSPCVDAGDPLGDYSGDLDMAGFPRLVDGNCDGSVRADIGAYEFHFCRLGDFDGDCDIDMTDLAIFSRSWRTQPVDMAWNALCDISLPANNFIDFEDLTTVVQHWLSSNRP